MRDMNKHIVRDDDNTPFHSSGFANAANGSRMGSTGGMPFEQRQRIDQERQIIRSYRHSSLGRTDRPVPSAIPPTSQSAAAAESKAMVNVRYGLPIKQADAPIRPMNAPRRFNEPPPRMYNPFS